MTHISDERLAEIVGAGVPCVPIEPWEVAHVVQELRSLRVQGGVRVKPLEWDELNDGKTFRALLPIIGSIRVEPYGVCGWWEVLWSMPGQCDKLVPDVFDTPEEAKAAAQADYERRILSSLEASPAPVSEAMVVLLAVFKELMGVLRAEAPGTPLNNHKFDGLGVKAFDAIAKAEAALAAKGGQ